MEFVSAIAERRSGPPLKAHLKIDTGMRRFGVLPSEALAAMRALASAPTINVAGVFTHFAQADEPDESPTLAQLRTFNGCLEEIRAAGLPTGLAHAANSAGQLRSRNFDAGLVRLGIALYGIPPSAEAPLLPGMRPAMSFVSRVQRVFPLSAGEGVSYGAAFRASAPMTAVLVPVGYADGYRRALSNLGEVVVNGARTRVLGRVCMDQMIVAAPEGVDVVVDNEVTLWGGAGGSAIRVAEVADRAGTIAYELVSGVAARVPRHYLRNGALIAVEDLAGLHRFE
jgi:alanine racemase